MFVKWHEKKWQKDVNQMETYLKAGENQTLTLRLQQSWLLPAACLILFAKKKKKLTLAFQGNAFLKAKEQRSHWLYHIHECTYLYCQIR